MHIMKDSHATHNLLWSAIEYSIRHGFWIELTILRLLMRVLRWVEPSTEPTLHSLSLQTLAAN